jgi:hypothetical protein
VVGPLVLHEEDGPARRARAVELSGNYGDRIGRKVTLIATLLLTGLSPNTTVPHNSGTFIGITLCNSTNAKGQDGLHRARDHPAGC